MKKLFKPFGKSSYEYLIPILWVAFIFISWAVYSNTGTVHMFPSMKEVGVGFADLWKEGLVTHIFRSLGLFLKSVMLATFISVIIVSLSPLPILKPIATTVSKFRFLPLTGIGFYLTMFIHDARMLQTWILVIFMSTFLITSLLSMVNDIPDEDYDHAKVLGYSRWQIIWEIIIKGRLDYILDAIRQNLAIVWMMIVTVESILVANGGLGFLIKNSNKFMNHGRLVALQIIILLIGLSLDKLLTLLRKVLFKYSSF